ncbi:MAG: hypothetical protein HC899_38065 [Leptolyngbyaceae cyanobacterium SM1_4_3]|nr:hypothetical protein [Leptolyngbyaceae cyanobacterium SM1_4_3]
MRRFLFAGMALIGVAIGVAAYAQNKLEAQTNNSDRNSETWIVVRVQDGDTLTVGRSGVEEKIRLCGLDAPELAQPLGEESKQFLEELVNSADGRVEVVPIERDRYDRLVAEVFVLADSGERSAQTELLSAGMAYVYDRYVDGCENAQPMRMAQAIAQREKVGVWSSQHVPPWEYRQYPMKLSLDIAA